LITSTRCSGELVSINPFDDDKGSFFAWSTTMSNTVCGRPSPMFQPADGLPTPRVWTQRL
jgi:hypothetical protein